MVRDAAGSAAAAHETAPQRDGVPTAWAFSRFLAGVVKLEQETGAVSGMADALRGRLQEELPGFGRRLGYDGKAVPSRSTGRTNAATGRTSDPDADWGKHETRGVDGKTGRPWTKVRTWFGYGLHVIADVEHEIPVWFGATKASASEQPVLSAGVDALFEAEPALAERCADFCADRGLDGGPLKRKLWDAYGVRPLVDVRELWREEKAEPGYDPARQVLRSLAADGGGNVLHSEKGEVFCGCPATGEVRPMAFQGFEADRCPAAAYGLDCKGRAACLRDAGSKAGDYGRVRGPNDLRLSGSVDLGVRNLRGRGGDQVVARPRPRPQFGAGGQPHSGCLRVATLRARKLQFAGRFGCITYLPDDTGLGAKINMGDLHPIFYVAGTIAAASALIGIGMWIGGMNHHKADVVKFMDEIRADIKRIFERLPQSNTVSGGSPLRLTELGQSISDTLGATAWAERMVPDLVERTKGKQPFEVQAICRGYIYDEFKPDDERDAMIQTCAYDNGLEANQVLDVLVVELRDRLLVENEQ